MTGTHAQSFEHDSMSAEHLSQPEQLALFVNLDGFEGPIDLLLNLAREQKLDLKKIAILPLAEQYLRFINDARDIDLEIAAGLVRNAQLSAMRHSSTPLLAS